jgi:hypothetical protein
VITHGKDKVLLNVNRLDEGAPLRAVAKLREAIDREWAVGRGLIPHHLYRSRFHHFGAGLFVGGTAATLEPLASGGLRVCTFSFPYE